MQAEARDDGRKRGPHGQRSYSHAGDLPRVRNEDVPHHGKEEIMPVGRWAIPALSPR